MPAGIDSAALLQSVLTRRLAGVGILRVPTTALGGGMAEQNDKQGKKVNLQIQLDDDMAQGAYVNLALVNHTETEFVMDFIFVQPQQPKAKVRARILSSPKHTKRLLKALQDNVERYESRFGTIDISGAGPHDEILH
jgi:hypothetical protein